MVFYYAVHKGIIPGIYTNWLDCKKNIDKFDGAIFKKFNNKKEAEEFLKNGFGENKKPKSIVRKENDDKRNNNKIEEFENEPNTIFIYTDGSCIRLKNNLCIAGYGIFIPSKNIHVSSPLLNQKLTNNRAELTAIIESIKYLDEEDLLKKIVILTDSQYSMYLFNGTGERYEKNNYKNEKGESVPNIDLIKKLLELKQQYSIHLLKVRAHTGKKDIHSLNNEIVDKLANDGAFSSNKTAQNEIFKKTNDNGSDNESEIETKPQSNQKTISYFSKKTNQEDIKMNELFESEEATNITEENFDDLFSISKKNKNKKTIKLTNWFIKK